MASLGLAVVGTLGFTSARVGGRFGPVYLCGPEGCFMILWVALFGLAAARWKCAGPMIVAGVALHAGAILLTGGASTLSHDYRTLDLLSEGGPYLGWVWAFFGILTGLLITGIWKWVRSISRNAGHR